MRTLILIAGLFSILSFLGESRSWAVFTVGESGEVIKPGTYSLGAEPQIMLSGASGINISALGDYPINSESSVRGHVGTGQTSFDAAASYKWVPIPDFGKQPAIGGKVELETASNNGVTINALHVDPLVSKKFTIDQGLIVPYGALPITLMSTTSGSQTAFQLAAGSEYHHPRLPQWTFGAELGINFSNAYSYISGVVTYNFDQPQVPLKKKGR